MLIYSLDMLFTFTKKIRKIGKTLIVSIPSDIVGAGNIEEGQYAEIKIKIINKETNKDIDKTESINILPNEMKQAIIKILNFWYELELKIENADHLNEVWITSKKVKELIESQGLYDLNSIESKNINVDIGNYLVELGFTEFKRSSDGNLRRIELDILKELPQDITK